VVSELLRHGLDIGFFIRELGGLWRDLFLLRQAGEKALPLLGLPEAEGQAWLATAGQLSPAYIHAAWQITLEAQRKVLYSLEPAQSLEMLLLNLTYLPQLLPLDDMAQSAPPRSSQQSAAPAGPGPSVGPNPGQRGAMHAPSRHAPPRQAPPRQEPARQEAGRPPASGQAPARPAASGQAPPAPHANTPPAGYPASSPPARQADQAHEPAAAHGVPSAGTQSTALQSATWDDFLTHYDQLCRQDQACLPGLRQVRCDRDEQGLALYCQSQVQYNGLHEPHKWRVLEKLVLDFFGPGTSVRLIPPNQAPVVSASTTAQEAPERHPLVSEFVQHFKAKVVSG
jgi:DNA polymerase III subunit gamma/tau